MFRKSLPLARCSNCLLKHFRIHNVGTVANNVDSLDDESLKLKPVIGLEIHAQIKSKSKLFSGSENKFMSPPNSLVAKFDASIPGTLPVLNKKCVEAAVQTGLALNCKINMKSFFDRKHYFYADTPLGYQITQKRRPIAVEGRFFYPSKDGTVAKSLRIIQVQIEQDSGKTLHDDINHNTFIDLNRANVGLLEIVTAPHLSSAEETCDFVKELQTTLKLINVCDGKMQEGQFRVDANVSISTSHDDLGIRTEIKNISGLKALKAALEYEIKRQLVIIKEGGTIVKETRDFDDVTGKTVPLRAKDEQHDYRFMPEPNLPPLTLYTDETSPNSDCVNVDELKRSMPVLPSQLREIFKNKYQLDHKKICNLMDKELALLFHQVLERTPELPPIFVYHWMLTELISLLHNKKFDIKKSLVSAEELGNLLTLLNNKEIDLEHATQAFEISITEERIPVQIAADNFWIKISDPALIELRCKEAFPKVDSQLLEASKDSKPHFVRAVRRIMSLADSIGPQALNKKVAKPIATKLLEEYHS